MQSLPIDDYVSEILRAVQQHPIVIVEAPPGAGKTTRVAPSLLHSLGSSQERIYLLQPRRIAAKSVADRIAKEQVVELGKKVGYQVRFDSRVSAQTQLIVATEGILLRRLQEDPTIQDVKVVLLDEFHERSLDADLLLGMLRRIQSSLREDLRIVIMSATIDSDMIQQSLGSVPVIRVVSRSFPVQIRYRPSNPREKMVDHTAQIVSEVFPKHDGDILVFLPGAGEIQRVYDQLDRRGLSKSCDLITLFGSMSLEEQSRAIETGPRRRIVLATNIAETSLTLEGIRVVVDSGQARVLRFSSDVGLDRLCLENISQASATQRAGRAGRVAPGVCYRLWSEAADRSRAPYLEPEIRRIDLSSAVLQLYAWGESSSTDFPWLEPPRPDSVQASQELLSHLGAVQNNRITELGKLMARLPIHPRLSRMVLEAVSLHCISRASLLAAMLSERDPFDRREQRERPSALHARETLKWDSDPIERLNCIELFLRRASYPSCFGELYPAAVRNIRSVADQIQDQLLSIANVPADWESREDPDPEPLMRCLLAGYPDRLARRRGVGKPTGLMVGGKGVSLARESGVSAAEFFLCIDVDAGRGGDALVRQASRVDVDWILDRLVTSEEIFFHPTQKQVVARKQTRWIDLVLQETPMQIANEALASETLYKAVLQHWDSTFPYDNEGLVGFVERARCLKDWVAELELPEIDDSFLKSVARQLCEGKRSLSDVKAGPWLDWLQNRFTSEQLRAIEKECPAKITVPSGSSIKIQYERGKPPILAVKIQEVFGWKNTPRIAKGRIPVLLHLLSPAMRPQQVTDDLASFWANGYPEVKKELKRRYPKHSWPDDPTIATPGRK